MNPRSQLRLVSVQVTRKNLVNNSQVVWSRKVSSSVKLWQADKGEPDGVDFLKDVEKGGVVSELGEASVSSLNGKKASALDSLTSRRARKTSETLVTSTNLSNEQILQVFRLYTKQDIPSSNVAAIPAAQWNQARFALLSSLNVPVPSRKSEDDSSSVFGLGDSLFLSCIYPGSSQFLDQLVAHLSHSTASSMVSFDLHDLLSLDFVGRAFPHNFDSLPIFPTNNARGLFQLSSLDSQSIRDRKEEDDEEEDDDEEYEPRPKPTTIFTTLPNFIMVSGESTSITLTEDELLLCRRLRLGFIQVLKGVATDTRVDGSNLVVHFRDVASSLQDRSSYLVVRGLYQAIQDVRQTLNRSVVLVCSASPPLVNSSLQAGSPAESTRRFMEVVGRSAWARHFTSINLHPHFSTSQASTDLEPSGAKSFSATSWFEQLIATWKTRTLEINLKNIRSLCRIRGVDFRLDTLPPITEVGNLSSQVWPKSHLIRLMNTTIGYCEDSRAKTSDSNASQIHTKDIIHCLQFVPKPDHNPLFSSQPVINETNSSPEETSLKSSSPSITQSLTPGLSPPPFFSSSSSSESGLDPRLDALLKNCDSYEKKLLSCIVKPSSLTVGFNDIRISPSTVSTLQNLITLPLLRPDWFSTGVLARHFISGVLLFGPPGTGKTLLAKAVAKESGSSVLEIKGSDVYNKYVGEGEKTVQAIFRLARRLSPCIIFVDEVDALFGSRRNDVSSTGRREIINQFMTEWDGLTSANKGVMVMAATNRPFDLDDAILRRLPRRILVDLPNSVDREHILKLHLNGENLDQSVKLSSLASKTEGYSGSDLKNLCVAAAIASLQDLVHKELGNPLHDSVADIRKLAKIIPENLTNSSSNNESVAKSSDVRILGEKHFQTALNQVNASISDEMGSVFELRKWDKQYGDGAPSRLKKVSFGFGGFIPSKKPESSEVPSAPV